MHTPLILASLKRCMILTDLDICILLLRPLAHFTHLFSISWAILLSYGILKSQRLRNSILFIINPNGSYIEAKVFSIFLSVKRWLSVGISDLNVSLCVSQFNPSIFVSFAFVPRCSFAKFNSFWELKSMFPKFGSLECHLWSLNRPFSNSSMESDFIFSTSPNHWHTYHFWFSLYVLSVCFHTFQNAFLGFLLKYMETDLTLIRIWRKAFSMSAHKITGLNLILIRMSHNLFWRDDPFSRQSSRECLDSDLAELSYSTLNLVDSAFCLITGLCGRKNSFGF